MTLSSLASSLILIAVLALFSVGALKMFRFISSRSRCVFIHVPLPHLDQSVDKMQLPNV